jgi:hypothetical protein
MVALMRLKRLVVALVGLACLLGAAGARVDAGAAAVDLAGAQVDELQRLLRHTAGVHGLVQVLDALHRVGKDHRRVLHSCLHDCSSPGGSSGDSALDHTGRVWFLTALTQREQGM